MSSSPISTRHTTWLRNAWYVAATSDEIAEKPLGRQICGERIAFYRRQNGGIGAVQNFCPHRGAPLSLGFVEGELLVCGYHGLKLACDGRVDAMPGQRVRGFPAIRAYPVAERYGFIWVWPGDAALADTALLPDLFWAENPAWAYGGGLYHINCDYRLMIDNLMDLTHETYVHAASIGQKEIDEAPVASTLQGSEVITSRFMNNVIAPPFWRAALDSNGLAADVPVDRWQICRFALPSHIMIEVAVAHAGQGGYDAAPEHKAGSIVVDFITPETETSIWYFWGMARAFQPEDQTLTDRIRQGQGAIFAEDQEMLEQQQRNHLHYPHHKLLKLNIDSGGVMARRMIDKAILAENAATIAG